MEDFSRKQINAVVASRVTFLQDTEKRIWNRISKDIFFSKNLEKNLFITCIFIVSIIRVIIPYSCKWQLYLSAVEFFVRK